MIVHEDMYLKCEVRDTDIPSRLKYVLFRCLSGFDFYYTNMILPIEDIIDNHGENYVKVKSTSSVGINQECYVKIGEESFMVHALDLIG